MCVRVREREREREEHRGRFYRARRGFTGEISPWKKMEREYIHGISYPRECLINYQNVK